MTPVLDLPAAAPVPLPPAAPPAAPAGPRPYRFTVAQYQRMTAAGILTANDRVELRNGFVVEKMPRNPPHDAIIAVLDEFLRPLLPPGWCLRPQLTLALGDSQPEPDLLAARGRCRDYLRRHPTGADAGLVIEVADSSLLTDRREKAELYARAGVPTHWVVNLVERRVEVHTGPGAGGYAAVRAFAPGEDVPLALPDAAPVAVPVAELLP